MPGRWALGNDMLIPAILRIPGKTNTDINLHVRTIEHRARLGWIHTGCYRGYGPVCALLGPLGPGGGGRCRRPLGRMPAPGRSTFPFSPFSQPNKASAYRKTGSNQTRQKGKDFARDAQDTPHMDRIVQLSGLFPIGKVFEP